MKTGKPYLDGLIDRLLMPLPSMTEREVQELMGDAAQAIHRLASQTVPAGEREREVATLTRWAEMCERGDGDGVGVEMRAVLAMATSPEPGASQG